MQMIRMVMIIFVGVASGLVASQASAQDDCLSTKVVADDPVVFDYLGASVALEGQYLVVGATGVDDMGYGAGAVYVFTYDGASWVQQAKLVASDGAPEDRFGEVVAISGSYILVGASRDDDAGASAGSAYIFEFDGSTWVEEAKLTASDASEGDEFGEAVAISGTLAVIGASSDDDAGNSSGSAYIFTFDGSTWVEEAKLTASDATEFDDFGKAVATDGDLVVVSATWADRVYVFERVEGVWTEQTKITAGEYVYVLGKSLSLSGDELAVTASIAGSDGMGAVYIFEREGTTWTRTAKVMPNDPFDERPRAGATTLRGDYLAMGAVSVNPSNPSLQVGRLYLFQRDGSDWIQEADIRHESASTDDYFGLEHAMVGDVLVIGRSLDDEATTDAGAVYVYDILGPPDCNADTINDACELDCNGNGIPEDCEPYADCNESGMHDACDVYFELRPDCNGNGVPDECDVADGTSDDCNLNIVPDECEPNGDCNNNGVEDLCDIGAGTSEDCNANSIPDGCDVAANPGWDCNENGVPDTCESEWDCNNNGVLDVCDIVDGLLVDEDGDWLGDICEICDQASGAVASLIPVSASGEHNISILDQEITLGSGEQRVFLEMVYCNWDPNHDYDPQIKTMQMQFDLSGFGNEVSPSDLAYAIEPCTTHEQCESIFEYDGVGGCRYLEDTVCDPLFMDIYRPDWPWVDLPACDPPAGRCGYTTLFCGGCPVEDLGFVAYLATVAIDVPADAIGQFVLPMVPSGCFLKDVYSADIPFTELRGLVIQIAGGCCLPDGTCNSYDVQACVDAGGTPTYPTCQGDCDGNGIDDTCEAFDDCNGNGLPDACDVQAGRSDDANYNTVPDECEPGACCACPPGSGCEDTTLDQCNEIGAYFAADQECALIMCPAVTPPNNDCADGPEPTYGLSAFDTRCASTDGPATRTDSCASLPPGAFQNDIWFEYVATCDYRAEIVVGEADYGAYAAVYCDGSDTCSCPADNSSEYACGPVTAEGHLDFPVTTGNCYTIRVGGLYGAEGMGTLEIGCYEAACYLPNEPDPEPTVPDEGDGTRNRYLSLQVNDPDRDLAIRVRAVDLPEPFEALEGAAYWIGQPFEVTEISSAVDDTPPTLKVARLECEPHFMDWTEVGPVHAFGPEVVPDATYEIQAIDSSCYIAPTMCSDGYASLDDETLYSLPLTISTSRWGDVTSDCSVWPCGSPHGDVSFVDIAAMVDKFRNSPGAPSKSRTDVAGDPPDLRIDFLDISYVVDAFRGKSYPFDGPVVCD